MQVATSKQLIADCNKLAKTSSTLSIYFLDIARRLELFGDTSDPSITDDIRMIREMLVVLRCGVGDIERAVAEAP